MNSGKRIDEYIEKFLGNSGIISLDVGTIIDNTDQWQSVDSYCDSSVASLHSFVSHFYVEKMGTNEPINYLYDVWKDSEKDDEIVTYSFSADGYVKNSRKQEILDLEKNCHFCKYDLTNQEHVFTQDYQVSDDLVKKLDHILQANSQKEDALSFDKFVFYQDIFTKLVLTTFNDKLKNEGKEIKYVTIVLLRSNYDGKWHLSYNAAIFSNNLSYLDNHAIYLLFDYFSRGNYLKEIESLKKNVKKEAIKSAISAIMSRNMSHNLGSHYMYYTKAYLEQLANSVNDIAPDIRGAAKVLGYVQARMDYLATVISNDKYPYGAVNFKSQIYDELTIDDFSHRHFREDKNKRTTNFLLTNLILSENFTRPDVRTDEEMFSNSNQLFLHVKLFREDNHYADFTGTWHSSKLKWFKDRRKENPNLPTMTSEEDIKNQLSSLNIALPGGSMSCHALFNVIENFIRNSAKYLQNDINKEEGLICTLAIAPNPDKSSLIDITIYDNKKNANKIVDISRNLTLYELIIRKLESLVIIDDQDKISKDNKGFKEMLFSSIWMRAYAFGNDKTYADIISDINNTSFGESKIDLIERYGFSLVRIRETQNGDITIYNRKMPADGECNLGLTITLPVFKPCDTIMLSGVKSIDVNNILNVMADIVEVDKEFFKSVYHHVFTRPLLKNTGSGMSIYEKYHRVVADRFPDIDKYALSLEKAEDHYTSTPKEFQIFFKRHMSTAGNADPCDYKGYAYADTISGGNFTITLLDLFKKGYENGEYKSDDDRIFALKIKESALTRITVIDERLFNSTEKKDYPWLSLKNLRVLNYDDSFDESLNEDIHDDKKDVSSIFIGNSFEDGQDRTHFLTIHLGLIEKILKNSKFVNALINIQLENVAECGSYNPLDPIRVRTFMKLLRMHYSEGVQRNIYIAIHSGRGNYSAELEGPLSKYPFISLSALENAFNNSKYQLSQLLYNTVYIGKGFANNI